MFTYVDQPMQPLYLACCVCFDIPALSYYVLCTCTKSENTKTFSFVSPIFIILYSRFNSILLTSSIANGNMGRQQGEGNNDGNIEVAVNEEECDEG